MKTKTCVQIFLPVLILLFTLFLSFRTSAQTPFITVWKTDNPGSATSASNQVEIPFTGSYTYTWVRVGTPASTGSGSGSGQLNITFPAAATYRLSVTPSGATPLNRIAFVTATSDATKLIGVEQWASAMWSSMQSAFANATNLTSIVATDIPNLSGVTSMREMFYNCYALTSVNGINSWNVSSVTNMQSLFSGAYEFNNDISSWNVSNVTNMRSMFYSAGKFNQNIGGWNVSKVINMSEMFYLASSFNQDISSWTPTSTTNMSYMFYSAGVFNQDISSWPVSTVTDMSFMFQGARQFNQPIGSWNVSNVTTMTYMFMNADKFNQPLSAWNVSKVTTMASMFQSADLFNQPLGTWNLSAVTSVTNMFNLTAMNCSNYSNTLIGWANAATTPNGRTLSNNTLFAGGSITYGPPTQASRNTLTTTKGWTITGDAYDANCVVSSATLPVKFLYFAAVKQNGKILLQWSTAFEQDNTGFEIQRSIDGSNWEKTGFVNTQAPNGSSSSVLTYNFTDHSPYAGSSQYRLKQIDTDGTYEYSEIRVINLADAAITARFYPNPVQNVLIIEGLKGKNKAEVLNTGGQTVITQMLTNTTGINSIDVSLLPVGVYFIKITTADGKNTVQKIIKG